MKSEEYVCCISFPWDCSSIGQSTALSRRKLRVRAPSVPTNPINNNPKKKKNTSIHLFIFCKRGTNSRISFPKGILIIIIILYYLYIYFRFSSKQIQIWSFSFLQLVSMEMDKDTCGLVQLLVASYSGF